MKVQPHTCPCGKVREIARDGRLHRGISRKSAQLRHNVAKSRYFALVSACMLSKRGDTLAISPDYAVARINSRAGANNT